MLRDIERFVKKKYIASVNIILYGVVTLVKKGTVMNSGP
jgi:hypothetical protein